MGSEMCIRDSLDTHPQAQEVAHRAVTGGEVHHAVVAYAVGPLAMDRPVGREPPPTQRVPENPQVGLGPHAPVADAPRVAGLLPDAGAFDGAKRRLETPGDGRNALDRGLRRARDNVVGVSGLIEGSEVRDIVADTVSPVVVDELELGCGEGDAEVQGHGVLVVEPGG